MAHTETRVVRSEARAVVTSLRTERLSGFAAESNMPVCRWLLFEKIDKPQCGLCLKEYNPKRAIALTLKSCQILRSPAGCDS
jgi:hypothetical protein